MQLLDAQRLITLDSVVPKKLGATKMSHNTQIRILEKENNKHGDLFGRLMSDLFLALGYDDIRLNIHKTGRELDLEGVHRTESRRVVAECKATTKKIGGDAVNKFVGVLDAEKRKKKDTIGYFISLSSFSETAIEQEKEAGGSRVILLNGKQVIDELVKGKIVVSPEKAMERAGRCSAKCSEDLIPEENCELLAHQLGWIWLVHYTKNKQRTKFALIHADGEPLAKSVAEKIQDADKLVGGKLHSLEYLSPPSTTVPDDLITDAKKKYSTYLSKECGAITLEGLPADQEVGSKNLSLENIFVPLYLESTKTHKSNWSEVYEKYRKSSNERIIVGSVLSKCSRLAILADPGGGKTTLLKRIATAYAFPDRRKSVDDKLPAKQWLPLFIRCRQLSNLSKSSILEVLFSIPKWAEMEDLNIPFSLLVKRSLRDGKVLLLIDGLDEISDEAERMAFIQQLRLFLSIYPAVGIIITSREAGFRIVGGALSTCCKHYRIADFNDDDIKRLTLAWHKEVIGDQEKTRLDAEKLAKTICETERVRTLARNPLLLTTLLLVKRWVGQLPSRRSVLYGKAIEVLLMTWNVEGYRPIEQDEAIPQLAFIAFAMMKEGVQRISSKRLKELLALARTQMPDVLGYARIGVSEFVKQIELRSSILIFSGHSVEQGTLYPMYEFRHLTFQEYLTACAIVNGYYPNRNADDTILSILEPYLMDSNWKEVIPLTAILSGRNVQPLIKRLIEMTKQTKPPYNRPPEKTTPLVQLSQCFIDEVQVAPDLLEEGLEWVARRSVGPAHFIAELYKGKYGNVLSKVVMEKYSEFEDDLMELGGSLSIIVLEQIGWNKKLTAEITHNIVNLLQSSNLMEKVCGALAAMEIAFEMSRRTTAKATHPNFKETQRIGDEIVPLLSTQEPRLHLAAAWALAWLGYKGLWSAKNHPAILHRLFTLIQESPEHDVKYVASWAFTESPIIDRDLSPFPTNDQKLIADIKRMYSIKEPRRHRVLYTEDAAIIAGFYAKAPWTDGELKLLIIGKNKGLRKIKWKQGRQIVTRIEEKCVKRITDFT